MATVWSWNKRHYTVVGVNDNTSSDLFHASTVGDIESVNRCMNENFDINDKDESGWTPLMFSSFNHQIGVMKLLLDTGASVDIKNNQGETALILVVKTRHKYFSPWAKMDQLEAVKLLISHQADSSIKDDKGWTALKWAKFNNLTDITELLKDAS